MLGGGVMERTFFDTSTCKNAQSVCAFVCLCVCGGSELLDVSCVNSLFAIVALECVVIVTGRVCVVRPIHDASCKQNFMQIATDAAIRLAQRCVRVLCLVFVSEPERNKIAFDLANITFNLMLEKCQL